MEPSKAPEIFLKPYDPAMQEPRVLALWEKGGYGNPDVCVEKGVTKTDAPSYSIVLPPPNVTGTLHMGHAAMLAIQDILIRYHRMKGLRTLWLPGTDHAAIATQSVVEKELQKKEKKTRHDLGREEFLKRVEDFAQMSHDTIVGQIKAMGASVDWSREAYTLDETRSRAVQEAFKRMYDAGLIYRGNRIVNWDPKGQTTVSDDEVTYEETTGVLYTFRYSKDFPVAIATTRPETKVGDTAVAVHPNDKRYKEFIGQKFDVEFAGAKLALKIIADTAVDPEFGTGAVGVTPAHSFTDWEIAQRHELPLVQVIDEHARMTEAAGELVAGKKASEARERIVSWLKENDLLDKEEQTPMNIAKADRSGGTIEPLPKLQWWVAVDKEVQFPNGKTMTLKEWMKDVVSSGQIKIVPERFEKIYYNWIDNLRPWCISRQIWYGHRIPVWYHEPKCIPIPGRESDIEKCIPIIVSAERPECKFCAAQYHQDLDTLDTWFSSGLWTFSTLGWPEKTRDLEMYHPTDVLETGYDILFFWVARMILMTGFLLADIPFRNVYLHGLVRDEKGRKMSKSLGNIIDPLVMIQKYGADAARLSLIIGASPGNDVKLSEPRVAGYKNFANKIWNITRFVLENFDVNALSAKLNKNDEVLLEEAKNIAREVTKNIEEFRLDLAANSIYHFVWDRFAAEIIEESKPIFKADDGSPSSPSGQAAASRRYTLYSILYASLKLLHPFMPFVTEAIWRELPQKEAELLMVARWPQYNSRNV
ncbi:valine--tRNA ligase [Candidatus Kaiserbacteria bacterium]|nr:valine--tRNA ligase [Candidatus Kaiserbacteria bacterium]